MRSTRTRVSVTVATTVLAFGMLSGPALADPVELFSASDFFIPRPASATDQEGVERPLASFDLAANGFADLIGQECLFVVTADNGDSVNENNYAILRTNGSETNVYDTESQANVSATVLENDLLTIGPTIDLSNVMLPGAGDIVGTSVDFTVSVDCTAVAPTTSSSTTSSSAPSSTTSSSTTVVPPGAPTTTTTAQITTSTAGPGVPTTQGSTTTTIGPVPPNTLPFTGASNDAGLAVIAIGLLFLGGAGVVSARPRGRHSR